MFTAKRRWCQAFRARETAPPVRRACSPAGSRLEFRAGLSAAVEIRLFPACCEILRELLGVQNPPAAAPDAPSEYDLKIDAQVEKFVENKQKLAYFLITASVTVIGFIVNFAVSHPPRLPSMVIFASAAGLFTAGFSLLNLR